MSSLSRTATQLQRHYRTLITGDVHPVDHTVEKGDAREHGWRELFRRFLPDRYGVKSGFIIDASGNLSEQVDCLVYRKDMGIELYSVGHHTVIPAESVFGAFEIKPSINSQTLGYAQKKAVSISNLMLSNIYMYDATTGDVKDELGVDQAQGRIIIGLLADEIGAKARWKVGSFVKLLGNSNTQLSVFMTIDNGCVDTLDTAYPTKEYTLFDGDHALLNQFIRLAEGFASLEEERCLQTCCLSNYKQHLDQPTIVKIKK